MNQCPICHAPEGKPHGTRCRFSTNGNSNGRHNSFHVDLTYSLSASDETFWEKVYLEAFPNIESMQLVRDIELQRLGIDRIVTLTNGNQLRIDEKKRRKVYNDILIEYLSNDRTNAPGWIEKNLAIDYLAYAFMPTRRVFFFPFPMLQRAWKFNKNNWFQTYTPAPALNETYTTMSLPVPIKVVQEATTHATVIQL